MFAADGRAIRAVDGVSFDVQDKEFVALVGPSGCGKSTVLNMIAGLVAPTGGVIRLDGQALAGIPRKVGYVFQKDTVFPSPASSSGATRASRRCCIPTSWPSTRCPGSPSCRWSR
jgi:ABC-type nitrate/sulfonate/bicarbonate transport system ATPase subunit